MQNIFRFLEVDDSFIPDVSKKHNQSKNLIKFERINKLLSQENILKKQIKNVLKMILPRERLTAIGDSLRGKNIKNRPKMKPETREMLNTIFKDDLLKLQSIIDQDISHWLSR